MEHENRQEAGFKPVVTVITVCYNSERTIGRTIESVLNQTYTDIEYVIIDGNSKDGTLDIIREYEGRSGGRMRVVSEPDDGIYDAMNKGLRLANGALIGILNSDDHYEKDAVENIVKAWNGEPMQVVYGLLRLFKGGREDEVSLLSHEFLDERMIWHPSCFVTKDVYDEIGMFDVSYKYVADYDFMLRAYESGKVTFKPIYRVITNFSDGGACGTIAGYKEWLKYMKDKRKISYIRYMALNVFEPMKRKLAKIF